MWLGSVKQDIGSKNKRDPRNGKLYDAKRDANDKNERNNGLEDYKLTTSSVQPWSNNVECKLNNLSNLKLDVLNINLTESLAGLSDSASVPVPSSPRQTVR